MVLGDGLQCGNNISSAVVNNVKAWLHETTIDPGECGFLISIFLNILNSLFPGFLFLL